MKTQEYYKESRKHLISKVTGVLLLILAVSAWLASQYIEFTDNVKSNKSVNKEQVLMVNGEVLVRKTSKQDTIVLYVKSSTPNVVEVVDSSTLDTVTLDSLKLKPIE